MQFASTPADTVPRSVFSMPGSFGSVMSPGFSPGLEPGMGLVSAPPVLVLPPVAGPPAGVVAVSAGPPADEVLDAPVAHPVAAEIVSSNPSARPPNPRAGRSR
jgi:hypothetical protein